MHIKYGKAAVRDANEAKEGNKVNPFKYSLCETVRTAGMCCVLLCRCVSVCVFSLRVFAVLYLQILIYFSLVEGKKGENSNLTKRLKCVL